MNSHKNKLFKDEVWESDRIFKKTALQSGGTAADTVNFCIYFARLLQREFLLNYVSLSSKLLTQKLLAQLSKFLKPLISEQLYLKEPHISS